jgi:hypothetical protein
VREGVAMEVAVEAVRHGEIAPTELLTHPTFDDGVRLTAPEG